MRFLGGDDNEQVEREGCRSLEFVRRYFVGPHVGVRKAGLVSTSACAPLGAFYLTGSSARETRTTAAMTVTSVL